MTRKIITLTSPGLHLSGLSAALAATPGSIEASEAQGQKDLKNHVMIPREMHGLNVEQVQALGFTLVPAEDDPLFYYGGMPMGWEINADDHNMWSYLHDDKGRKRASIFYKAAFYDRRADISWNHRYCVNDMVRSSHHPDKYGVQVEDSDGNFLYHAGLYNKNDFKHGGTLATKAAAWLVQNFPLHMSYLAYWD